MGEFITKIALVIFGVSIYKTGYLSVQSATGLTIILLVLNFLRDVNLRYRQAIRMVPGYGFWFFSACSLIVSLHVAAKQFIGYESLGYTFWEGVFASGVLSMLFRAYTMICESISRWTVYSLGWDNRRVDYAMDHMWRNGFLSKYFYWNPDYLNGYNNSYDEVDDHYDDDNENYDHLFVSSSSNQANGHIENNSFKCIPCCSVQPKR